MPSAVPTVARVTSLTHWTTFFHPTNGIFRLPHTEGRSIEHLDIDLRFIQHKHEDADNKVTKEHLEMPTSAEIYLPNVCIVTLRGAEHVHDSEEMMECLAEVLIALKPVEVHWVNATSDPTEQITFSTHLVHPAVVAAGEAWSRAGGAKKLVIQGGFPCPNLSAPTPFSLTPAATPSPSPGPNKTTFGAALSALPALSLTKPKTKLVDEAKQKERSERQRLAEYSLKPRFDFAFGSWGADEIEWRFDGRYTPACIRASIEHLLTALNNTFPSQSKKSELDLPSVLTFAPLPIGSVEAVRGLVEKLELDQDLVAYLHDCVFFAVGPQSKTYARLFETQISTSEDDKGRQTRRLRAEAMLLAHQRSIVASSDIFGGTANGQKSVSMSDSVASIMPGETDGPTDDEASEAVTPELMDNVAIESAVMGRKGQPGQPGQNVSPSAVA